jgi:hypothetical protein
MKPKFEFYKGDILGIIAFFVCYKIGSVVFLILIIRKVVYLKRTLLLLRVG